MTRTMPGFMPIIMTVILTVALGGVSTVTQGSEDIVVPVVGVLVLAILLTPFVVPLLWAWVLLKGQPLQWVLIGVAVWLAAGLVMLPSEVTWLMTTHVVTGLVAGVGLVLRWKPGYILLLLAVVALPSLLWSLQQMPMDEVFEAQKELALEARHELLKAGTKPGEEPPSMVQEEQLFDEMLETILSLTPSAVVVVLLAQATFSFGLIWILVRVMGLAPVLRGFPPLRRWRFPFAVVWVLAAGVGLMIVPLPFWPAAGLNLVIVVCAIIAVQGAALQWHMGSANVPIPLRLFFMFMAGMLFLPLVLLGLADQWMDFRKLEIKESDSNESDSGPDS